MTVLKEFVRVTGSGAVICIFEPNDKTIDMIRGTDPSHPDGADPGEYARDLGLVFQKRDGVHFDAFVYQKQ